MFDLKYLSLLLIFLFGCNKPDLTPLFKGLEGTMVVYNQNEDEYTIVNKSRSETRYLPCSTFKIPNSLIALETGVVPDVDTILEWDKEKYPEQDWWFPEWKKENNLRTAMEFSVVPVYRTIASKIGLERMQQYVNNFKYGSKEITTGVDIFWLNSGIKISALEQIEFLSNFYNEKLNISKRSTELVKEILVREETDAYRLSYKTGGGYLDPEKSKAIGWLVGYVEKENNVYFFAMNIEGDTYNDIKDPRIDISKSVLKELGII